MYIFIYIANPVEGWHGSHFWFEERCQDISLSLRKIKKTQTLHYLWRVNEVFTPRKREKSKHLNKCMQIKRLLAWIWVFSSFCLKRFKPICYVTCLVFFLANVHLDLRGKEKKRRIFHTNFPFLYSLWCHLSWVSSHLPAVSRQHAGRSRAPATWGQQLPLLHLHSTYLQILDSIQTLSDC